jgi:hypothetical protein
LPNIIDVPGGLHLAASQISKVAALNKRYAKPFGNTRSHNLSTSTIDAGPARLTATSMPFTG